MAGKDDDFDEWLDDIDGADSELDQNNIDELLSAAGSEANDLDDQAAGDATSSGELDQANIDALLGLNSSGSAPENSAEDEALDELDQDNIDALLSGTGYDADAGEEFSLDELEQENIDALLDGSADLEADSADEELADLAQDNIDALLADSDQKTEAQEESQSELGQDDIDSLLSTDSAGAEPEEVDDLDELFAADSAEPQAVAPETSVEPDDFDELDQDNIDALFNDIDAVAESASSDEDQSLDELFASDDEEEATVAATESSSEQLSPEDADDLAASAFDSDLDDMDKLFADIDDEVEDEDPFLAEEIDFAEMLGQTDGDDQEFIELDAEESQGPAAEADDFMAQAGAEDDSDVIALPSDDTEEKKPSGPLMPAALAGMNKTILTGIGGALALLLLFGLYFLFSGPRETTMEAQKETTITGPQTPASKMAENFIPVSEDGSYDMGSQGGELAIELRARDQDDQPLIYEITSQPLHGRLSGTAPHLTYLPDNTFPGQDRFEFTVSDGKDTSDIAQITISGPDLATLAMAKKEAAKPRKKETAEKKIFQPQKPKVLAKNAHFSTISTSEVTIDWSRLWHEANHSPYVPQAVHVEIVDTAIKGDLTRSDPKKHIFRPDPYSANTNTIHYRFKKGGFRSTTKTVTINVALGSPAPEINIAKLTDRGYMVGQNVVIDASASRDEARDSLQFFWEQKSGVQIDLHPINEEGSKIAFTMPSSFYTDPNPGPTIALTAVDNTGKEVRKEIKVKMVSRRQTALWRGEDGSVAPDPPMQGRYFPWPFDD